MTENAKAMSLREKLMLIQTEIKAPKNRHNSFGNYDYRNAEDIQESLKPYEKTYNVAVYISDTIEEIGGRVYVKATATICDIETQETICVTAYAREAETKKGMDEAQVTGATSSYARKYALNGLLLLDDTKDVDTDEYQQQKKQAEKTAAKATANKPAVATSKPQQEESKTTQQQQNQPKDTPHRLELRKYMADNGFTDEQKAEIAKECGLGPKSTDQDYEIALMYARTILLTGGVG